MHQHSTRVHVKHRSPIINERHDITAARQRLEAVVEPLERKNTKNQGPGEGGGGEDREATTSRNATP
jgi:hypothetical protein